MLRAVDPESLDWKRLPVPSGPEEVITPHGTTYLNMNMIYNDLMELAMSLVPYLPDYDEMSEEEIMIECDKFASAYMDML